MENYKFTLSDLMRDKNLTQIDLAEMLGIKSQNVSRWTTGKVSPTVETVVKLCRCLNCTPNDLIKLD